jgi:hypothetical protein
MLAIEKRSHGNFVIGDFFSGEHSYGSVAGSIVPAFSAADLSRAI